MVASPKDYQTQVDCHDCICPDLRDYWQLVPDASANQVILQALQGNRQFQFSAAEGFALQQFTGKYTVQTIQTRCSKKFTNISPNLVAELLHKLIESGILAFDIPRENGRVGQWDAQTPNGTSGGGKKSSISTPLKPCVQWIKQPYGSWILRNPEYDTFMELSDLAKAVTDQLGQRPTREIVQEVGKANFNKLLQGLAFTGMLVGTEPPKPRRGKFTPLSLLFFKIPLGNPDPWLTRHVDKLRFLWTPSTAFCLCVFLALTAVVSLDKYNEILFTWRELWKSQGAALILPMALLSLLVVTLHELGHAFTLKHYGSFVPHLKLQVPEVGVMFMCFMPAAYTDTTNFYCLTKRYQRVLVVAAGVLVQFIIAAVAFWLWLFSSDWLKTTSFLLLFASLLTVLLNLNPLAKFDGYYLAVAITWINQLRSRSRSLYVNWLLGRSTNEKPRDSWILAAYAPLSFAYLLSVFSFLLYRVAEWSLTYMPITTLSLLIIWAIYFYFPSRK
jgi:putative peptide zinc metalloprotease protein